MMVSGYKELPNIQNIWDCPIFHCLVPLGTLADISSRRNNKDGTYSESKRGRNEKLQHLIHFY